MINIFNFKFSLSCCLIVSLSGNHVAVYPFIFPNLPSRLIVFLQKNWFSCYLCWLTLAQGHMCWSLRNKFTLVLCTIYNWECHLKKPIYKSELQFTVLLYEIKLAVRLILLLDLRGRVCMWAWILTLPCIIRTSQLTPLLMKLCDY